MENINMPRCYKPTDFSQIVEYTYITFQIEVKLDMVRLAT